MKRIKQYEPFFEIPVMKLGGDIFDLILPAGKGGILIHETLGHAYALDIGGGHVDISTGEFVFNIFAGMHIKNGKPHAITNPFLFRGNILDVFNQIDMIGEDLDFQFGTCIKKGQMVPVSYGQPTIRIAGQLLGE